MTTQASHSRDHFLQSAIINELEWTAGINAEQIGVAVTDGAVTLAGQVGTVSEKDAAVYAAARVPGLTALADEISVRSDGTVNDADIARSARRVLSHHIRRGQQTLTATVEHHVVALTGSLDRDSDRAAARRAVAVLPGAHEVIDRVTVKARTAAIDIPKRIKDTLACTAQVDSTLIEIDVHDGAVALGGQVRCWSDRQLVELVAWAAPGVSEVHNNIVIACGY